MLIHEVSEALVMTVMRRDYLPSLSSNMASLSILKQLNIDNVTNRCY